MKNKNICNIKHMKKYLLIIALIVTADFYSPQATAQVSVGFQVFYDDLSPYGYWINNPSYGYVWVPNVGHGFRPYGTNGHWVLTDYGWTWYSDYAWGWAPFHYGRWYSDPVFGPIWVPGNEWGPGWVTWRQSGGYYGWAPIEPGISISVAYSSGYNVPYDRWVFVRDRDFGRANINNYYVSTSSNTTIIHNSTVINNIHGGSSSNVQFNKGPDRREVEKHVGKSIRPVAIKESNKPGQSLNKDQLQIYRPRISNNGTGGHKAIPGKVADMKEIKPAKERNPAAMRNDVKQPVKQKNEQQSPVKQPRENPNDRNRPGNKPNKEQQINKQPMERQPMHQKSAPDRNQKQERKTPYHDPIQDRTTPDRQPMQERTPEERPKNKGVDQNQPFGGTSHNNIQKRPTEQPNNKKQGDYPQQRHKDNIHQQSDGPKTAPDHKDNQKRPH